MSTMFENLDIWFDKGNEANNPSFIIACRDREIIDGDRWVLSSLSIEETKRLYVYLGKHINV